MQIQFLEIYYYFSVLSSIAIIVTMICAILQLRQNKLSLQANLERQTKSETIVFTTEILEKLDIISSEIKDAFGNNTINVSDLEKYPKLKTVITQYLALMERISVGLNTHVYDLNIYARICRTKTLNAWRQLEPIIIERRKSSYTPKLYIEFEEVIKALQDWEKAPKEQRGDFKWLKLLKEKKHKKQTKCSE